MGVGMEETSVFIGEKLLRIEAENGIFELKVNEVYLWQYVRYYCLTKILEEVTGIETINKPNSLELNCAAKNNTIKEWIKKQQFLVHKKDILVLNHPRRVKEGNYYKCYVTDAILDNMDYSYYVYENKYNGTHLIPVKTKNLRYVNIDVIKKFRRYDEQKDNKSLKDFIVKIVSVFEQGLGVMFSRQLKDFLFSYIKSTFHNMFYYRIWAEIVLTLVHPRVLIVTVGYNPFIQVVVAQAKKHKIHTIELQHGRIGDTHIAYNYVYRGRIEAFADYMFAYGDYEKVIPRYPVDKDHVKAVGYPELEKKSAYYLSKKRKRKQKIITFISGPEDGKVVSKYAINLRKNNRLKNVRMIYKLHPSEYGEWEKWYPDLVNSELEIVSENTHDIYYYIGNSDYIVGISSTVLFEAVAFNARVFIIKEKDYRKAEVLCQYNMASFIRSESELEERIISDHMERLQVDNGRFFKKDSVENIKRELKKIISS